MPRFIAATVVLLAAATVLVGCVKEEEPEPQWTEESAYAAAEETFRAYWAAGDQSVDSRVELLTKEMQDVERDGDQQLEQLGVEVRGTSRVESSQLVDFRKVDETAVVELTACIDGSDIEVRRNNDEWTSPREDPIYQVEAQFETVGDEMLLADLTESESDQC